MELPKALLGAILLGITVQATSCSKEATNVQPDQTEQTDDAPKTIDDCPACGMG